MDGDKYFEALDDLIEDLYDDSATLHDFFHFTDFDHAPRLGQCFQALKEGKNEVALLILENMRKEFSEWIGPSLEDKAKDQVTWRELR